VSCAAAWFNPLDGKESGGGDMRALSLKLPRENIATTTLAVSVALLLVLGVAAQETKPSRSEKDAKKEVSRRPVSQPIPFSHKTHSAQNIECAFCHTNPDPGETMAFPDSTLCMDCHQAFAAEKPAIKKLARFAQSKRPIPWVRVYSVPGFVFWSHRTHLEAAQPCAACHGKVSEMDVLQATNVTTMDGCVQCHEKKDASTGCVSCHEGRGAQLEQPFKLPTSMRRNPESHPRIRTLKTPM
jgi:hypothetical protein